MVFADFLMYCKGPIFTGRFLAAHTGISKSSAPRMHGWYKIEICALMIYNNHHSVSVCDEEITQQNVEIFKARKNA